jgi:5-methylcytosine-specific restriction endonuclease McrA
MKCGCTPKDPTKTNVDHIKPRRRYPELALEFSNLQILCNRCNKQKGNKVADYRPRPLLAIAEQVAHQSIGEL